jgi:hypothetical protein
MDNVVGLSLHGKPMELLVSDTTLAVFVDDTGHEALVEGHTVYGLGGCAVLGADLDRLIRLPWHKVRMQVTGSPDTPLHAVSFSRTATPKQIEAVAGFFRTQPFARIGAIVTVNARLSDEISPIETIAGVLKNRILDIAKWTRFTEIQVIFESSDRANRQIRVRGLPD